MNVRDSGERGWTPFIFKQRQRQIYKRALLEDNSRDSEGPHPIQTSDLETSTTGRINAEGSDGMATTICEMQSTAYISNQGEMEEMDAAFFFSSDRRCAQSTLNPQSPLTQINRCEQADDHLSEARQTFPIFRGI